MDIVRKKQPLRILESFPVPKQGGKGQNLTEEPAYLLLITDIPRKTSAFDIYHNLNILTGNPIENVKIFKINQNENGTQLLSKTLTGVVQLTSEIDYFSLLKIGNIQIKPKTGRPFQIALQEFYCAFEKRSIGNNLSRKILLLSFYEFNQLPTTDQIQDIIKIPQVEIVENYNDLAFYLSFKTVIDARDSKRVLEAMGMRPLLESEVMRVINFQRIEHLNQISADNHPIKIYQHLKSNDFSKTKYPQSAFKFYFDSINKIKQETAQTLQEQESSLDFKWHLLKKQIDWTEIQDIYNIHFKKQNVSQQNHNGLLNHIGYLSGERKKENLFNIPLQKPTEKISYNSQIQPKEVQCDSVPQRSTKQSSAHISLFEDLGKCNESLTSLYCELRRPEERRLHYSFNLRNNPGQRT